VLDEVIFVFDVFDTIDAFDAFTVEKFQLS
jgi:hypothetical protein